MSIKTIFTGSYNTKMRSLENVHKAVRYQLEKWATGTVLKLKRSAGGEIVGKYKSGRKTSFLKRNIGYRIFAQAGKWALEIGTGVGTAKSVVYARILEKGGKIRPKEKKYLTVPFPNVRGSARNYPSAFVLKSKAGNLLIVERAGAGFKPLFTLKKQVRIPSFKWFSIPVKDRLVKLDQMMSERSLIRQAEKMR